MAEQKALIRAMGLSELDTDNDKFIKNGKDYPTRKKLQALVLKSTLADDKPDGPLLLQLLQDKFPNVTCK